MENLLSFFLQYLLCSFVRFSAPWMFHLIHPAFASLSLNHCRSEEKKNNLTSPKYFFSGCRNTWRSWANHEWVGDPLHVATVRLSTGSKKGAWTRDLYFWSKAKRVWVIKIHSQVGRSNGKALLNFLVSQESLAPKIPARHWFLRIYSKTAMNWYSPLTCYQTSSHESSAQRFASYLLHVRGFDQNLQLWFNNTYRWRFPHSFDSSSERCRCSGFWGAMSRSWLSPWGRRVGYCEKYLRWAF